MGKGSGGKSKKRSRAACGGGGGESLPVAAPWSGSDHAVRQDKLEKRKLSRRPESESLHRRAVLTHETREKRDAIRLRLHITKAKREISQLKARLESWDPQEEAKLAKKLQEARRLEEEPPPPKKKKGRKGPESWKLKGAARPAQDVYDFDTRYVDPHIKAHTEAREKAKRSVNVLSVYKGRLARDGPEVGREYLAQLMQLGHLSQESRQFKTAREAWLECIELEGDEPVTTARECLMRMYLDLERYDAALRLGDCCADDSSVWIRYSAALVGLEVQKTDSEQQFVRAIQANLFCAYYLAYKNTFSCVMEYTNEIEDADDQPQSSLEEAIEYCSSDQAERWVESKGCGILRDILMRAAKGDHKDLAATDVDWSGRLDRIEQEYNSRQTESSTTVEESSEHDGVDVRMYIGMFRTAMEMVQSENQ